MATSKTSESASKKTTTKKVTAKVTEAKPEKMAAKTTKRKKSTAPTVTTSEDRIKMIEVAAYYIAEKNGFGENHMDYWLQAEQEVDAKLTA